MDFCHFPKFTDRPEKQTFVWKHCWSELWHKYGTFKLSTFTRAELALKATTSLIENVSSLFPGVEVSAEPLHQDTVVNVFWPALLFRRRTTGRRFKRTLTITPPPPRQRSLLPSFNSDVVDLKATHLFGVSFFSVVRLFFFFIITIMY